MRSRAFLLALPLLLLPAFGSGCAGRTKFATVDDGLALDQVVLYRNGVGYFERRGEVDGDILSIRVRKDQVNDLLKSLTVVDAKGRAVSVSMPLDPQSWANAAVARVGSGQGLAGVLSGLKGTEVVIGTATRRYAGRITLVEKLKNEPDPAEFGAANGTKINAVESNDYKITLLNRGTLQTVRLSKVKTVTLRDGDLALQLHRSLDAAAGEGMFQQIQVDVRLAGARSHQVTVSYVVEAPMWKPTYRVVLPEDGKGEGLLQAWAVVDNVSGEDWNDVGLSLTSGAPIAFRYDLHTPRGVTRTDLTSSSVDKRARVSLGETSYGEEPEMEPMPMDDMDEAVAEGSMTVDRYEREMERALEQEAAAADAYASGLEDFGGGGGGRSRASKSKKDARKPAPAARPGSYDKSEARNENAPSGPQLDADALRRSMEANARSKRVSGLTRIDLADRVTVPDGTSTMVALINETVQAEQTFMFTPGGAGYGYESNPYRVVRFRNNSAYVLEPGPISIYSGGSFVGEGLSEAVGTKTSVTIPFAVEPNVLVTSSSRYQGDEMRITRIVRGVIEVESFYQTTTKWDVRGQKQAEAYKVLVRQPQQGPNYELANRPEGTEDLEGAYLIPIEVPAGATDATVEVIEQTPSKTSLTFWDGRAVDLLNNLLDAPNLDAAARKKLEPIVELRRKIGKIDTEVEGKRKQQRALDQRAAETRANLEAIKKDNAAGALRKKLNKRLDDFASDGDELGREIVELNRQRLELKIELEDLLQDFDFKAPAPAEGGKGKK